MLCPSVGLWMRLTCGEFREWVKRAAGMSTRLRDLEGKLAKSEEVSKELTLQKEVECGDIEG